MAKIQSGATADEATVDPVSKAIRVTLYDSEGNEQTEAGELMYFSEINIDQTTAAAAGSLVWALVNGATKYMEVAFYALQLIFDGTTAAGITKHYQFVRFSGGNPTGGVAITPMKQKSTDAASTKAFLAQLSTGLGVAGLTFEPGFTALGIPLTLSGLSIPIQLNLSGHPVILQPGEGFGIRLVEAATIGMGISGVIHWDELPL